MSERLEGRAEVVKLSRLLSVEEHELAFLEQLPAAELRAFREQATNRLFDASATMLGRVGAAARLLPSALIATIAQRSFGPLLCARAAGTVDTAKALDVATRLPATFLADVTIFLDPRRVAAIIAEVPEALVVPVASELGARGEHVTMGRFLAYVPDHAIVAAIGALDDETMLRTAFVLEHKDRLDHAVGLLPPDRLPGILRCAADANLWPEALDLLDHLSDERRGPIADLMAAQDEAVIADLVHAVSQQGIWDGLLPVVRTMSPKSRVRLATVAAFHDPDVMTEIVRAAASQGLWVDLVPLIDALPPQARGILPQIAAGLERELLLNVIHDAARTPTTLPTLLAIAQDMDPAGQEKIADAIDHADERIVRDLLVGLGDPAMIQALFALLSPVLLDAVTRAAASQGLWLDLVPLIGALAPEARGIIAQAAARLEPELLLNVIHDAVRTPATLPALLAIAQDMDAAGQETIVDAIDHADEGIVQDLLVGLGDPATIQALVALLPPWLIDPVTRAAKRHGVQDIFEAAPINPRQ